MGSPAAERPGPGDAARQPARFLCSQAAAAPTGCRCPRRGPRSQPRLISRRGRLTELSFVFLLSLCLPAWSIVDLSLPACLVSFEAFLRCLSVPLSPCSLRDPLRNWSISMCTFGRLLGRPVYLDRTLLSR